MHSNATPVTINKLEPANGTDMPVYFATISGTIAMSDNAIEPAIVNFITDFFKYSVVDGPGLIPGMVAPVVLRLFATYVGLNWTLL